MAKSMIDVSVLGMPELQRKLNRVEQTMRKKIVRQALREGGRPILAETIATCPVRTGALKASLKLRVANLSPRRRRAGEFGMQVQTGTREDLGIAPGDPYYYPAAVEWGTAKLPAVAFMRRATDTKRPEALAIIAQVIRTGITEAARGH